MNVNLPTMAVASHSHTAYSSDELFGTTGPTGPAGAMATADMTGTIRRISPTLPMPPQLQKGEVMPARRIVQVFIADTNDNIPLEDCLLFKGEEKLTDATDQELFFELDIRDMLERHNEKRVKIVDKKVKDRTEYLEPAKVRDLKMVVVTVAGL